MKIDKQCSKCRVTKPLADFYTKKTGADGYMNHCKQCTREWQTAWRERNPDYNKDYSADWRIRTDPRLRQRYDDPQKVTARNRLSYAVRSGKLARNPFCQVCWDECKTEGHHEDYSQPLDVIWLCSPCHNYFSRGVGYEDR